ncbi:single-stranded-DNA-specific exonuclease RecJ [Candidatus Parcubacteria bacterium]|nr:MAG: single-stranded-DNA-specific exonuclease RecJ [Candidatus Parcubacteria bacterium]
MKKWKLLSNNTKLEKPDQIVEQLLVNRGIEKNKIGEFLNPNLSQVNFKSVGIDQKEVKKAVDRIQKVIKNKEKVIIFGDYDVDGICGTTILWEVIYDSHKNTFPYIPDREEEGYGLSVSGIKNILVKYPDCKLIITVDNGIVANEAVDFANSKNIDVIITDHHLKGKRLPKAHSIIHTTHICGSAVAWLFSKELDLTNKFKNHLELAAIATVADLVPLQGANRTILKFGLDALKQTKRIGLTELLIESGIDRYKLGTYEIGHIIGPRINASGRITHALDSLRLLCTKNHLKAREFATLLGKTNKDRQLMTSQTFSEARSSFSKEKLSSKIIFASHKSYNQGIIGLVASKLVEEFYRPSFVLSIGEKFSKGSARSISGLNIIEFIRLSSPLLAEAGGHAMAAGFTVETARIDDLKKDFEKRALELINEELLQKTINIDFVLDLEHINFDLFDAIQKLAPFGIGNPEPVFVARKVKIEDLRLVGAGKHVKLKVKSQKSKVKSEEFDSIAFGMGEKAEELNIGGTIDIVYTISLDTWNGTKKLQLKIRDIETNK